MYFHVQAPAVSLSYDADTSPIRQFQIVNLPQQLGGGFTGTGFYPGPSRGNENGTAICPIDATGKCHNNGSSWCECTTGETLALTHTCVLFVLPGKSDPIANFLLTYAIFRAPEHCAHAARVCQDRLRRVTGVHTTWSVLDDD